MQTKRLVCAFSSALAALATGVVFAQEPAQKAPSTFNPGTYTATVNGHNAPLTVTVTLTKDRIENIDTSKNLETIGVGRVALQLMTEKILNYQSLGVDAITGATVTSSALYTGVKQCLEQAGADLYGTPWRVFKRVTLPQLWPGVLAGAMLAFVISLDDVVITEFVKSAGQDTLPTYMLGQLRRVITPEVNAISTVLLAISVALVIAFYLLTKSGKPKQGDVQ